METYHITRYLDARYGIHSGEVALCNLAFGTRILAQEDSWEKLKGFEVPGPLPKDDPWLERARAANLLKATGDAPPDFIQRLRPALVKCLQQHGVNSVPESWMDLLGESEALFRRHHMPRPKGGEEARVGPLMHKPERLVDFVFDHIRAFLEEDLEGDRPGLKVDLAEQFSQRPAMKLRYEQQFCTPHTTQLRARRIRQEMSPGQRVLVLGDDDLVSLALLEEEPGVQVDVLELDPDLVAFLKEKGGDRLTVLEHNLRHGVPDSMRHHYHRVTTDPPYAADGMQFFLQCARDSLIQAPESRLFLSTYPGLIESPEQLWADIKAMDLRVEHCHSHFSRYIYNNSYRVEHLAALRHLGSPLHPTAELIGFPFLYAHFYECRWA